MDPLDADRVPLPEHVYVPVAAATTEQTETGFELRRLDDGRTALSVYSDLAALVEHCGAGQPWYLLPRDRALALHTRLGTDLIVLDLPVPSTERHPEPGEHHG